MKSIGHWTIAAANEHGWWGANRFFATPHERIKELVHALHDAAEWQEQQENTTYSIAEILYQ